MNRQRAVDVVVVGGGPAGGAAALRLARAGCSVVIAERSDYVRPRMGETLPPIINLELSELGLLDTFVAQRPTPSHESASAWSDGAVTARSTIFDPYGVGWHVDRARFDAMFTDGAAGAGATVMCRADVHAVTREADGSLTVVIDHPGGRRVVPSREVVDATGRSARIARALGATSRRLDTLVAVSVVCELPPGVAPGDTFVEAAADGWWYASPLPGGRRIISFFTDSSIARSMGVTDPSGWWEALHRTDHVVHLARQAVPTARPTVASAASRVLSPAAGDDWMAIGDAALAVDPLSSSGVANALAWARAASAVLAGPAAGRVAGAVAYDASIAAAAARYVAERARYYGLEERFADAPFWQARRAAVDRHG